MMEAAGATVEAVAAMRLQPSWPEAEAVAHTLVYEAAVMGPGNALPADRLAAIAQPTLVLTGANSPAWITNAGKAVATTIPAAADECGASAGRVRLEVTYLKHARGGRGVADPVAIIEPIRVRGEGLISSD
jgi:hypothetical protein